MKARIKASGEVVNILKEDVDFVCADNGYIYKFDDIEILNNSNVENHAWSDEDDKALDSILNDLRQGVIPDNDDIDWLKSLKGRIKPQWKPSEAQLIALDEVYKTHGANSACRRVIFNLLNELKKLSNE
jgi:hypothetical protein